MSAGYVVMQQKKSCSREKQDHFALVFVGTKTSAILVFCLVAFRCGRETSSDRFFFHTISVFSDQVLLNATYTTRSTNVTVMTIFVTLSFLFGRCSINSRRHLVSWSRIHFVRQTLETNGTPPKKKNKLTQNPSSHEPWKGNEKLSNKKSFLVIPY